MARTLNRLTARSVQTITKAGRHADGGGLYLDTRSGGRRWIFMFAWQGKQSEMGLGSANSVSLASARQAASKAREALASGLHPVQARDAERAKANAPEPVAVDCVTFGRCADELLASLSGSWRNPKHEAQWAMTLREYAAPLRHLPVAAVGTEDVVRVLQPLWRLKPETASRLRGRIERVFNYAKAMQHRTGDNPALWRGHLDQILPKAAKLSRGHHKALPYADVAKFMADLSSRAGNAAAALRFTILTASRTGEALGARWDEMDLQKGVWVVPGKRMKSGRDHRVPLSSAALSVLVGLPSKGAGDYAFPTRKTGVFVNAPLSNMSMDAVLRRLKVDATVHGFRSTFRDWSAECTDYPNEVCEAALAHVIGDRVEAAYRRGDLFEKRRALMDDWARYCVAEEKQ